LGGQREIKFTVKDPQKKETKRRETGLLKKVREVGLGSPGCGNVKQKKEYSSMLAPNPMS